MKKKNDENTSYRTEKDGFGELKIPQEALYGIQTERAIHNFPISSLKVPRPFIHALGLIKGAAAIVNRDLSLLEPSLANPIIEAAEKVASGSYDKEFPLDIFQTGSGTSTNMNANEVIAHLATRLSQQKIHPNDHVNMCQSSNDVIPTAIHLSASIEIQNALMPALKNLVNHLKKRSETDKNIVKTGRTHLMDAMPITFGQEESGWAQQIQNNISRIECCLPRLHQLAIGGTAVGTGINAHPEFAKRITDILSKETTIEFKPAHNYFEALSCQDTIVELSGQLRVLAVSLTKICNDLRLMNSGPLSGLGEISLPAIQAGSSIMPGKVNPVIPEAICMACAEVMGNDVTITIAGQSGNFQLNTMLPVIGYNILHSIQLMSNSAQLLSEKVIEKFKILQKAQENILYNPILITALNPIIGYEKGALIAKRAYEEGRTLLEVALEMTSLPVEELEKILDPQSLTLGGIKS